MILPRIIEMFMLKRTKILLHKVKGLKEYQHVFQELNYLSLKGMNIGGDGDTNNSGEKSALVYIFDKLAFKDDLVIFDVGANIGKYTILLHEVFGENTNIFSFEPSKKTFNKLIENTKLFKNTKLHNFGFGKEDAFLTLYSNEEESGLASVYKRRLNHFNIDMNLKEDIEIKTIDTFCYENNIDKINFLKLDIEGNELNALEGAKKMLDNHKIDFIQFEFGGCNIDSRTYFQDFYYLLNENFYIYRIVIDGLYLIDNYKEMYESFITTNYLAERK